MRRILPEFTNCCSGLLSLTPRLTFGSNLRPRFEAVVRDPVAAMNRDLGMALYDLGVVDALLALVDGPSAAVDAFEPVLDTIQVPQAVAVAA